ncbi:MAG: hypothetical protein MI975_07565 [Cytophagales bacterium]|nr:hypothetical protein [Cytophagales bacterium]
MNYTNLISTSIPEKDLSEVLSAINFINDKLPELVSLSKEEAIALPKMSKNTIEFVVENLKEAETHPELVPEDIEIEEVKKDVELIKSIQKILVPLKNLEKKLEDSALIAGSEAYLPSIAIYNAMKADAIRRKHQRQKVKG